MQRHGRNPLIRLTWHDPATGEIQEQTEVLPISFGRGEDNTIILNSQQVSRLHVRLEQSDQDIVIVDQGSRNGTFVNEQRVDRAVLNEGGMFRTGPFTFVVAVVPAAPSEPQDAQPLVRWTDPQTSQVHEVAVTLPVTLGRDPDNSIVLSSNQVSRHHATIEQVGDEVVVVDNRSRNGTFVNGRQIERAPLHSGSTIKVGDYTLTIVLSDPELTQVEVAPQYAETQVAPQHHPTADAGVNAGGLILDEETNTFIPGALRLLRSRDFPHDIFNQAQVPVRELKRAGLPFEETTYLALGAGLGSFFWVDHLCIYGADPRQIVALGLDPKPHSRYSWLCRVSQIPEHERLRSNSDSCPDNIWGWPGYAVREIGYSVKRGNFGTAAKIAWQIFGEPTFADTYTPRSGDVFKSIDREATRIGWDRIFRYGRIRAIRQTDDGRYVVAYSQTRQGEGQLHALLVAPYVHLAVGYPGIRLLADLQEYRQRTGDFKSVVNAYEDHEHVYAALLKRGGTALVRGRGIVASRIMQRLYEVRQENRKVSVLHLVRSPLAKGNRFGRAQRQVEHHWEFQPFNWPKACWGGDLRAMLEQSDDRQRDRLLNDWGGTTTAKRKDWRMIINNGLSEGWYQIRFGEVSMVERNQDGKLMTVIQGKGGIQEQTQLVADFIIDCTGLEATIDSNPLLQDFVDRYRLPRSPKGRLKVANDFEVHGIRNGAGRMYTSGAMTLGGPYAAVDSFLGLQYAALQSVEALKAARAPGLRRMGPFRSVRQWLRWARGVRP